MPCNNSEVCEMQLPRTQQKISAPVPKSDAATAEKPTKYSRGAAQYSKEKPKSGRSKQKNAYPDYRL